MSIKAMAYYLDHSPLKGNDKLCMVILADYANDDGECFPGQRRIAKRLNMTESGARKILYRLRDAGEIEIINGAGVVTKDGPTNKYRLISYIRGIPTGIVPPKKGVSPRGQRGIPTGTEGYPRGDTDPPEIHQRTTSTVDSDSSRGHFREIVVTYENEIGMLTANISDELQHLVEEYPHTYIVDAIKISAEANKRNLRYVKGILRNWKANGKQDKRKVAGDGMSVLDIMNQQQ